MTTRFPESWIKLETTRVQKKKPRVSIKQIKVDSHFEVIPNGIFVTLKSNMKCDMSLSLSLEIWVSVWEHEFEFKANQKEYIRKSDLPSIQLDEFLWTTLLGGSLISLCTDCRRPKLIHKGPLLGSAFGEEGQTRVRWISHDRHNRILARREIEKMTQRF